MQAIGLKAEVAEVVESAVRALVSVLEAQSLRNSKNEEENITLLSERLEELANADLKSDKDAFANRRRWDLFKDALKAHSCHYFFPV